MKRLRREKKASRKRKSSRDENTNKTSANKVRRCRLAVASLYSALFARLFISRGVFPPFRVKRAMTRRGQASQRKGWRREEMIMTERRVISFNSWCLSFRSSSRPIHLQTNKQKSTPRSHHATPSIPLLRLLNNLNYFLLFFLPRMLFFFLLIMLDSLDIAHEMEQRQKSTPES